MPERELAVPRQAVALRDGELVLRAFGPGDVQALVEAFADPAVAAWNPGPAEMSDEAARAWLMHRADWTSGDHTSWAISAPSGVLLGSVSLFQLNAVQRDGEAGYWLVPAARGRGVASQALRLSARYAFDELGLNRLTLFHAVDNVASCRVANAAGFQVEGTLRQSHRYGDGIYHDEHVHGRLVTDAVEVPAPPSGAP